MIRLPLSRGKLNTISNPERGFSGARMETALDIADVLGVTPAELFDADGGVNDKDRERRKAIEKIVALVGKEDAPTLALSGETPRTAMQLRASPERIRP